MDLRNFFTDADFRFCCLEAPLVNRTSDVFTKAGPSLKQHDDIKNLIQLFTHVSLANNHIMDYGATGLEDTRCYLDCNKISYGGAGMDYDEAYKPIILDDEKIKVAVLCLAESQFGCIKYCGECYPQGGYAWVLEPNNGRRILELKKNVDFLVCFVHAGLEMVDVPLPEWRCCYHSLIDYGCDSVIACHPHVVQGKECYEGKMIYYSLGNFFFNKEDEGERWYQSLSVKLSFQKDAPIRYDEFFSSFAMEGEIGKNEYGKGYLDKLSVMITDKDAYINAVDKAVLDCWRDYYESYFAYPIKENMQVKRMVLRVFYKLFKKSIWKCVKPSVGTTMLYHNMIVDTHRFAISRAISILNKTY